MTVKKDPSGRRSIELAFDVPGTPEQVWRAIATGPGISSWFTEAEIEEREGGAVAFDLGEGMSSSGVVTVWAPPERFAYEEPACSGAAPPLATEFVIAPRAEGGCAARLVSSLVASEDDWDGELESKEKGWPPCFEILRLNLGQFDGQPTASIRRMGTFDGTVSDAWATLKQALGFEPVAVGERCEAKAEGAPRLVGVAMPTGQPTIDHDALLRLEAPAPGAALIGACSWGGQTHVLASLIFYGAGAAETAEREDPVWEAWMSAHFPPEGG